MPVATKPFSTTFDDKEEMYLYPNSNFDVRHAVHIAGIVHASLSFVELAFFLKCFESVF